LVICAAQLVLWVFLQSPIANLRATAATRLFEAGVDEQLIKLKMGHSSDAVRNYKRISDSKLQIATDVIASMSAKVVAKTEDNKNDVEI